MFSGSKKKIAKMVDNEIISLLRINKIMHTTDSRYEWLKRFQEFWCLKSFLLITFF